MKPGAWFALMCALSALPASAQTSSAQAYPVKPVRIIIPFAPAGPTDNQARWAAQQLNAAFGQTFIADNRPGAGGVPGTEAVVKSPPDGYTLLAGNPGPLTIAPTARAQVPYDTLRDLAPIVLIAKSASCLCAHPSLPVKGVKDFIPFAKSRPGGINYGTPGVGTVGHFATELFATSAGVKLNHVPYKGAAQYTVDLIAGNIEIALNQFAIATPHVKQGKLRCLGVTSAQRTPLLPDVATISEQGLKGFESYNWNGMLAPAATPKAVIARIHEVIAKALKTPEAREVFTGQGHELGGLSPDEYGSFIRSETEKWAQVAKKAGIPKQ
ncbi:MAG TPA: tripartite tricarboxylate transporter substrate binding protein [Burkholderiales bacterium]|nr:tripartite tricarboxylate transporter substrate binding protein [Burkholderiales bacterium]